MWNVVYVFDCCDCWYAFVDERTRRDRCIGRDQEVGYDRDSLMYGMYLYVYSIVLSTGTGCLQDSIEYRDRTVLLTGTG